jgi:two-component system OmpR family response regulator
LGRAKRDKAMKSEPLVTDLQRQELKDKVFLLSVACPFDHGNPCACPLYPVRKMGVMERFEWLLEQSDPDLLDIHTYHKRCFDGKQGNPKKNILIIDDEEAFTKMLKMTLELNEGYEVCVVNDPRLAVDTAREYSPDIVILDMVMPDMDGGEVHRLFKADSVLKRIPIIFLSAIPPQKDDAKHKEFIGVSYYVVKPVSAMTLMGIIEDHFRFRVTEKSHER